MSYIEALAAVSAMRANRVFTFQGVRDVITRSMKFRRYEGTGSIATGNRHGGAHQHKREIARRLRQQERIAAKRAA